MLLNQNKENIGQTKEMFKFVKSGGKIESFNLVIIYLLLNVWYCAHIYTYVHLYMQIHLAA